MFMFMYMCMYSTAVPPDVPSVGTTTRPPATSSFSAPCITGVCAFK